MFGSSHIVFIIVGTGFVYSCGVYKLTLCVNVFNDKILGPYTYYKTRITKRIIRK